LISEPLKTLSGDVAIVTDKDWDSGNFPGWVFSFNINGGPWKVNVGDGGDRVDIEGNEIADGEWHMLSATFDRDGMLTIYEDGVQVGQSSMTAIGDIGTGFPISFGADADSDYRFEGFLAEVRVFEGLVGASAINDWQCQVASSGHPSYTNLIGHWKLDEASGDAVVDSSPTGADGVIEMATWQDATQSTFETVHDFSMTPRQVDYFIPALNHMCIPILPEWDLDGVDFAKSCGGDLNSDGLVNVADFISFNSFFGMNCGCCRADIDRSGEVDVNDFLLFNSVFGETSGCGQ